MSEMRRRWLQVHLSTAVVLVFVAGGILWANMARREVGPPLNSGGIFVTDVEFGFPTIYCTNPIYEVVRQGNDFVPVGFILHCGNLAINIVTAIATLAAVAFACEWRIRRREARTP